MSLIVNVLKTAGTTITATGGISVLHCYAQSLQVASEHRGSFSTRLKDFCGALRSFSFLENPEQGRLHIRLVLNLSSEKCAEQSRLEPLTSAFVLQKLEQNPVFRISNSHKDPIYCGSVNNLQCPVARKQLLQREYVACSENSFETDIVITGTKSEEVAYAALDSMGIE
ncbi:MAG: hypothetical protein S4CHLAM7_08180 [Chlamydiae bacterium]|nr:hypothetical protein [Chlamydiota bacterium]